MCWRCTPTVTGPSSAGNYPSLNQAYLAYQGFSFELPEGSNVIYATITDSNGTVIFSIQN